MQVGGTALAGLVHNVTTLNQQQAQISSELGSGLRLDSLATDPAAVERSLGLAESISRADAFVASAGTAGTRLQVADTALASVVSELTRAVSVATAAVNGTNNVTDQQQAANELLSIRSTILSLANSSYSGEYVFSGSATGTRPFVANAAGTILYQGSTTGATLTTPAGTTIPTQQSGASVFGSGTAQDVFAAFDSIVSALNSGTVSGSESALVGGLRSALDNVLSARQSLDANLGRVEAEGENTTNSETNLKAAQSTLLSADPAALATELSSVTSQRQALLSTIATVQRQSLFDYLK